ncbi:23S rRNA pseudouridine(2604) synthase RluF [Vibrio sp. WJH972]
MSDTTEKRLNKYISETGICSRREADRLIADGKVKVNGLVAEMGLKVTDADDVVVNGKPLRAKRKPIYIALNKPVGITCTTERDVQGNIVDFVRHRERIFPIGRLDKPSDGLIFLTNDGDIVNKILRAGNQHEKEYVVRVDKPITQDFIRKMSEGVAILDTVTLPCKVTQEGKFSFRIVLTQGLNRQIRRMCETLGYDVFKLRRVRIMNITLDGIPNGKWRYLSEQEVTQILAMCENSSGTEEASQVESQTTTRPVAKAKPKPNRRVNSEAPFGRSGKSQGRGASGKKTPHSKRDDTSSGRGRKPNTSKPSVKGTLKLKK